LEVAVLGTHERGRILAEIDAVTLGVPWSDPRACHLLFDLAASFERPQILEVACGFGKATAYLAGAARLRDGRVFAVDHQQPEWQGRSAADLVEAAGAGEWCELTVETDARWYLLDLLSRRPGEWIDLAFVDASHSVDVDAFVALAAWVHLRPGGVLVFDDLDWTAEEHGPADWPFDRRSVRHVRAIYDYVRGLPGVDEAVEWGGAELAWPWGLLRKRGPGSNGKRGLTELFGRPPGVDRSGRR
jgi:predicted O-methyltransferase YrrM